MPKSSSELVSLFKSLQPDSTVRQVAHSAAVDAAAQRWPLLNTLAPAKLTTPPVLTEDDRARWSSHEKPRPQGHKPALSLPAAAGDMALSLQRMAGRTANVPLNLKPEATPATPPATVQSSHHATPTTPASVGSMLNSKAVEQSRVNLFENSSQTVPSAPPEATTAADSLRCIFDRLEGKSEKSVQSDTKSSSFWTRLGRR